MTDIVKEPKVKVRIINHDSLNWCVQVCKEVKDKETEETSWVWKDDGFYGSHLDWAVNGAIKRGYPLDLAEDLIVSFNTFLKELYYQVYGAIDKNDLPAYQHPKFMKIEGKLPPKKTRKPKGK